MKTQINRNKSNRGARLAVLIASCCIGLTALAVKSPPQPGGASAYGKTLAQWQDVYWRWAFGELTLPTDAHGNAVVNGVVLMGLPAAPGDGTPASLDVTLTSGEPFMLPLWNLLGNTYEDGSSDPIFAQRIFATLDINLKIDGVSIINTGNVMQFYSQFAFNPPIPFDFPPAVSFSYFQGTGMVHTPLKPGGHTLTLDAKNTDSADVFGLVFEYHNTWNITIVPDEQ